MSSHLAKLIQLPGGPVGQTDFNLEKSKQNKQKKKKTVWCKNFCWNEYKELALSRSSLFIAVNASETNFIFVLNTWLKVIIEKRIGTLIN